MPRYVAKETRVLSLEEQQRFIEYLSTQTDSCKFGILFALMTGLRIGEVCALRIWDVSLADRTVTVHETMQRIKNLDGKGSKTKIIFTEPKSITSTRIVPLTNLAYALCAEQVANSPPDAFLLTGSETKIIEPRVLQYRIKKYSEACGIEGLHFHVLRHTFATRCVEVGFEIKSLSEILGHATPNITLARYVHSSLEFKRQNMNSFSDYLLSYKFDKDDILVPIQSQNALYNYSIALEDSLNELKQKRNDHPELFETENGSNITRKSLLDALYEEGIIPTYSFPKNVVSAYISNSKGQVKYQVERGLDIAISEYAPGRAIVVDKTTYQIGGFFYPGSERRGQTATNPARAFIRDANYCKRVCTCNQCGWFGLEEDNYEVCPFCGNSDLSNILPMLRPWGFAPRNATSIETAQLNEEYSATQQPIYSTLPESNDVHPIDGYSNVRMAVRPNQRIIMLNQGVNKKGFTICCDCGAAMPGDKPDVLDGVMRPYRSNLLRTRCKHSDTLNANLGYDFITDMLVLEIALDRQQLDINPMRNTWLSRSGQSLAEALRLAACHELDIEFTELVTGYRVRQNFNGDYIDIYLYDSLSSGAGYAVSIEDSIQKLLDKTRALLSECTCDTACNKCLKHYRNQYIHGLLDRKAALELLNWGEFGIREGILSFANQKKALRPLEQILRISGIQLTFVEDSISVESKRCKKKVCIYPAMWRKPVKEDTIFVSDALVKYAKPYALKQI